jgi:hypothetical protein
MRATEAVIRYAQLRGLRTMTYRAYYEQQKQGGEPGSGNLSRQQDVFGVSLIAVSAICESLAHD